MMRKLVLGGMVFLLAGLWFVQAPGAAEAACPRNQSIDFQDTCEEDNPPEDEVVESLGTVKQVTAGLSSDGEDKWRLFLFVFPGNAGQVYQIDYQSRRNDNPTPGVNTCVNSTSVWGQGVCHLFQQFKGAQRNSGSFRVVSGEDYTYYSHLVVRLDVDQTFFNENDVVAEFTMHRREFAGLNSPENHTPNLATGNPPRFSWDSEGDSVRRVLFMEGPQGGGSWDVPIDASNWSPPGLILNAAGRYLFHLEMRGPARYGGPRSAEWDTEVQASGGGGGGGPCGDRVCQAGEETTCRSDCGRFKCVANNRCEFVVHPSEVGFPNQCDSGDDCGPAPPGAVCGNGVREGGEQCDNGANNGSWPRTCSTACTNNSAPPVPNYCATFISQNIPASVPAGTNFNVSVTFENCGNLVWTPPSGGSASSPDGFKLGDPQDGNAAWGLARVAVPNAVPRGARQIFNFTATAPSATGTHPWSWRMVHERVTWFGDSTPGSIVVTPGAPSSPVVAGINGVCTLSPTYTGQGTISWTGTPGAGFGFWVDISTDPSFATYYNKNVPSGTTTNTSGFVLSGGSQPLVLETDRTYYVRVFNGLHSPTVSFMKPYCRQNVCDTTGVVSQCVSIIGNGANACNVPGDCPPPPPRCNLAANPNRLVIPPAQTSRLDWSCTNANNCTLTDFGGVPPAGWRIVSPTSTRTYTLRCNGAGIYAPISVDATIRVFNPTASGTIIEVPPQ